MAQPTLPLDLGHESPALAAALPARAGHYDELRDADGHLRPGWARFFGQLGAEGLADLGRRAQTLARQIAEDGVSYNVYNYAQRGAQPWSLDLLPHIVEAEEWAALEAGITQRARLLSRMMRDLYDRQRLLRDALLPPALVYGNPAYLRPLVGAPVIGGTYLHLMAFDLARAEDGRWWVIGQRTQAPSGLGYALQNRLIVSRQFPEAFREMRVQRLASSYRRLLDTLERCAPHDHSGRSAVRIVLLTPGPYAATYFEHAYLARYLGIPLVEGSDLTVREEGVFLKTLHGLQRVRAILRRLDDDYCDPLELRPDSALGVPGLLQAVRAGRVLVANALGSGFLESPALNGFLPAIAERLLGEPLLLPSLDSWWCGERAAFEAVADQLHDKVVKPTFVSSSQRPAFEPAIGAELTERELAALRARIAADPDAYTVQAYLPLPQAPTWNSGRIQPRAAMLRVFAIADGAGNWHAMPGGLTRVAGREARVVSLTRGGASQDTWVTTRGPVDSFSMLPSPLRPEDLESKRRVVSSRAAENLFWMGRYAERAEFSVRLARAVLGLLSDDSREAGPLLTALGQLAELNGLVPEEAVRPEQSLAVFERTLIAGLADPAGPPSVAYNLGALRRAAGQIRERLSGDHWRLLASAAQSLADAHARAQGEGGFTADRALDALAQLALLLQSVTGAQTDHMTRDDGWRLLTVGRQLERLAAQAGALATLFDTGAARQDSSFDLLLVLFDSTITYRALYQRRQEMPAAIDLLVQEQTNPRALARVVRVARRELARLPGGELAAAALPTAEQWPTLATLCAVDGEGRYTALIDFARQLSAAAHTASDAVGARYFSHAESFQSLAA